MQKLTISLLLLSLLYGCNKSEKQPTGPTSPQTTEEQRYLTVDYILVKSARPIKDTTPGNFFTTVVLNKTREANDGLHIEQKGNFHYDSSTTSAYAYSIFFSSSHLSAYSVEYNKSGVLRITTKQMNEGEFFWAYNGYNLDWYRVWPGNQLTIDFIYGEPTDSFNVDYIMKAFDQLINNPISGRKYL